MAESRRFCIENISIAEMAKVEGVEDLWVQPYKLTLKFKFEKFNLKGAIFGLDVFKCLKINDLS